MSERQVLDGQDITVELLTIRFNSTVLRYTNSVRDPATSVIYDAQTYLAREFSMESADVSAGGPLPRPNLNIDNIDRVFYPLVVANNDLRGADVTYRQVFRQNLDDGSNPDTTDPISETVWRIYQMSDLSRVNVTFVLATPLDVEFARFGRQALPNVCDRTYRVPEATPDTFTQRRCPYVGSDYFLRDGTPTSDWRQDVCGKKESDCELRFAGDPVIPFQGFPGLGRR